MELQDLSAKELILFGLIMRGYLDRVIIRDKDYLISKVKAEVEGV